MTTGKSVLGEKRGRTRIFALVVAVHQNSTARDQHSQWIPPLRRADLKLWPLGISRSDSETFYNSFSPSVLSEVISKIIQTRFTHACPRVSYVRTSIGPPLSLGRGDRYPAVSLRQQTATNGNGGKKNAITTTTTTTKSVWFRREAGGFRLRRRRGKPGDAHQHQGKRARSREAGRAGSTQ